MHSCLDNADTSHRLLHVLLCHRTLRQRNVGRVTTLLVCVEIIGSMTLTASAMALISPQ